MFDQNTNILVVDDSLNIRRLVMDNLTKMGFKKMVAASEATEGFAKLVNGLDSGQPFNLVLSDLNMPGPNGLEFLRQVRADERFKDLPFLLITTENEKGAVLQAAMNGVSGYIVKPFNVETLSKRLSDAWKKHFETK